MNVFYGAIPYTCNAASIVVALWAVSDNRAERVCVKSEIQTLPLYADGPKHHIHGPLIGYINKDVCVEWADKPKQEKKPFSWPEEVR